MPPVINVGGSLTGAIVITLVAAGIRLVRARHLRAKESAPLNLPLPTKKGRFHAKLSPAAVRMLVETDPIPHYVIHLVGEPAQPGSTSSHSPSPPFSPSSSLPLVAAAPTVIDMPLSEADRLLKKPGEWLSQYGPGLMYPVLEHLLVLVSDTAAHMEDAAAVAAAAGFSRTATVAGGVAALHADVAHSQAADLRFINRDAVAMILGLTQTKVPVRATVVDVRRSDERLLYGCLPGSVHVPMDQLPGALQQLQAEEWEQRYKFPRPGRQDVLVLHCRTNRKAAWAAQICQDAGLHNAFVYRQGTYGWRLDSSVKAYKRYEPWDAPPDAEPFQMEEVREDAALQELQQLGII